MNSSYAIILAGGSGTRLWPLSRKSKPKHLLALHGDGSLLQQTARRLLKSTPAEQIVTVTHKDHFADAKAQLSQIDTTLAEWILAEPVAKNTLPAIAWAVLEIQKKDPEAVIGVFPSDTIIEDEAEFKSVLKDALSAAKDGYVATFGIVPKSPATGYGYICAGEALSGTKAYHIQSFEEKPDLRAAENYLKSGRYYWNSGMFAFSAKTFQDEFEQHEPNLFHAMQTIGSGEAVDSVYPTLTKQSVDYGIMEKTMKGVVMPADIGWNDLGSWEAIYEVEEKDQDKNVIQGNVMTLDTKSSLLISNKNRLVTIGLVDVVVVQTDDATIISRRDRVQDIKKVVEKLDRNEL